MRPWIAAWIALLVAVGGACATTPRWLLAVTATALVRPGRAPAVVSAIVLLLGVLHSEQVSATAAAQSTTRAQAREAERRFRRGVGLYQDGELAEALVEFEASYALAPRAVALFNAARVLSRLGRFEEAVERFELLLGRHRGELDRDYETDARGELARALRRLARLTVRATPASATILVGRRAVASGQPLRLLPGTHVLGVRADGFRARNETVVLRAGERRTIDVRLLRDRELASLDVRSTPAAADVVIDGRRVGRTPVGASLPLGGHRVTVELSGHYPVEEEIVLAHGEMRVLDVPLEPRRSLLERPWFWVAVSTVVIGTTATWVYLYEIRTVAPAGSIGSVELER